METLRLVSGGFTSNCYIIYSGGDAFVIDPSADAMRIVSALRERSLTLRGILLTHGHFDHVLSLEPLISATHAPVYIHGLDAELLGDAMKNASAPLLYKPMVFPAASRILRDGQELELGGEVIKVLHTPGHTRGSVCFDLGDVLITGDTLFAEGYGRCDLYGGDRRALHDFLSRLADLALISDKQILCGHGEASTLRRALGSLLYL